MLNKKMFLPAVALAAAFTFAFSGEAKAQYGYGLGCGYGQIGQAYRPAVPSHLGYGHRSYAPNYSWRQPTFHDTTHLDYHPPQIIRHRRHFHVQPGHYDVHRTGHWHH